MNTASDIDPRIDIVTWSTVLKQIIQKRITALEIPLAYIAKEVGDGMTEERLTRYLSSTNPKLAATGINHCHIIRICDILKVHLQLQVVPEDINNLPKWSE